MTREWLIPITHTIVAMIQAFFDGGEGGTASGLTFLLFFSFFDDLAKLRNSRYVW